MVCRNCLTDPQLKNRVVMEDKCSCNNERNCTCNGCKWCIDKDYNGTCVPGDEFTKENCLKSFENFNNQSINSNINKSSIFNLNVNDLVIFIIFLIIIFILVNYIH